MQARLEKTSDPVNSSEQTNDDGNESQPELLDGNDHLIKTSSFNGGLQQFEYTPNMSSSRRTSTKITTTDSNSRRSTRIMKRRSQADLIKEADFDMRPKSPSKRQRKSSTYAPPSKYAHLPPLQDIFEPYLICVFVGLNPGIRTASSGHAYAHPSNLFWKLLHSSGCTDRRCRPEEDVDLPRLYAMGNTNIVGRPTKDGGELSKMEMAAGTPVLEEKIRKWKPEAVCLVGKGIWEAIWRYRYGKNPTKAEFKYGWQDEKENLGKNNRELDGEGDAWRGAKVFVACTTSGLAATLRPAEKEAIWKPFGEWVQARRAERAQRKPKEDSTESVVS